VGFLFKTNVYLDGRTEELGRFHDVDSSVAEKRDSYTLDLNTFKYWITEK
jgi:hypothetical protein